MSTFSAVNQIHDIYASIIKITFNKIYPFRDLCILAHFSCCTSFFFIHFAFAFTFACNCLWSSSCSCFFCQSCPGLWNYNQYFWFWKSLNMVIDAVQVDLRINISISIRSMIPRFGRQVHLEELTQMRLIKEVLVTSSHHDHVISERYFIFFSARAMVIKFWLNNYEEA